MNWLIPLTISCTIVLTNTYVPQAEDEYRSMAFVFDTTGSMRDDYNQLKEHAEGIMTYVQNRNDTNIKHFVYVPFNDPDVGPVSETFDPELILYKMDNIIIHGGYDCPEKGVTGVIEALKTVKPNSFIYVFTDASSKDTDLINEAFELIQIKQCQVVILQTGNCEDTDNSYERIASFSSGTVFDINKNELSTVLHFIKNSMNTNKVNLLSVDVMENHTNPYQRNLTIDESILSLRISVSGSKFELSVANPAGEIMNNKSYGMKTELNLENVKIVNILDPMPGEWNINVTSNSFHSIRANGISSKNFNFGFATKELKNITQTSHRPMKGIENYILIDCPYIQEFLSCNIQDLYSNGETKSLRVLNFKKNMCLCGPFEPTDNPFYVQIIGTNENGTYVNRITKTSITPNLPDKPHITTPKEVIVKMGKELRINCRVESLVPFSVTWNYNQTIWNFNETTEIEFIITDVTKIENAVFTFNVKNFVGSSRSTTNVLYKPVIDGEEIVTITLNEGEDYSLTCMGHGIPAPKMGWYMNNSLLSYHNSDHILIINDVLRLIIFDATLYDSNVYTCKASNKIGITEKNYKVTVKAAETYNSIANVSLMVDEHEDVILHCPLANNHVWLKNDMNLNDLINKRADEPHYKQTKRGLKIFDLNTLDNGIYACTNSSETYSYDLQVAYAPYFDRYPQETMMIRRNETVLLDCTAKGYPKPQVIWKKIDSSLPITRWTLKNIEFLENKHKLKIRSIDWIHNGTYSCIIKNKFGIEKRQFELLIF